MPEPDRPLLARSRRGAGAWLPFVLLGAIGGLAPALAAPETAPPTAPVATPPEPAPRPSRPAAPAVRPDAGVEPASGGFEAALRSRLLREGRRQGFGGSLAPPVPFGIDEGADDFAAAEGGRRASRTILRSLRGALDDHLETAARNSGSFAPLFRFLDARGATMPAPATGDAGPPTSLPGTPRDGAGFGVRFRIDAHPRLVLDGRVGRLEGRIEMPVLDREIRMTVEHPIGGYGGAALRGGHSADRGSWADLSLSLRF